MARSLENMPNNASNILSIPIPFNGALNLEPIHQNLWMVTKSPGSFKWEFANLMLILVTFCITMRSRCPYPASDPSAKGVHRTMLGIMRKYQKSVVIKVIFWVIVLSFIGTIFLIWGKGEKGESAGFAAKVDGERIALEEFQQSYDRLRSIYQQLYGNSLTPEQEKELKLRKMTLDSLVDAALVRREARRMGIKVNKGEVAAEIAKVPAFQKGGAFNFDQYQQMLRASRITPQAFEEAQERTLMAQKARQAIKDKVKVTDEEALQAFRKQNDRVELYFASFAPAELKGEVKTSEQELQEYLQKHQEEFRTPEEISISFLLLDPAHVAAKVTVSEEEAQTWYQKNIDRYQAKGGILPFAEVKERARADALKLKAAKEAYEMSADALNKNLKTGDLKAAAGALGVKVADTPLFTARAPYPPLAGEPELLKKAFTLKEGEMGGPVETSRGIYLLKLKERRPAAVPALAQIKAQVEAKAREEKARELSRKRAEETLAQMSKGSAPVKLQETGPFSYSAKGDVPRIGAAPELMEAAFTLSAASPAAKAPFKIGERWYAVRLKARTEMNRDAFQRAREQIRQALLPKKQEEAVEAWLKELRGKAKIEANPALLAD